MYGKIFTQIYDSSIAENYQTRLVFQDLIILSDMDGVVDMTHEAIARRTNVPIDVVRQAISELEKPDLRSRSPVEQGARIVRLDEHRDWGWIIVNHQRFRDLASETVRREKTRDRVHKFRKRNNLPAGNAGVTPCNAPVTLGNAKVPIQITDTDTDTDVHPERGGGNFAVELPAGFPKSVGEAIKAGEPGGFGALFVTDAWNKAVSRGGCDAKGNPIRSFAHYLAIEKKYDRERVAKNGNGSSTETLLDKELKALSRL